MNFSINMTFSSFIITYKHDNINVEFLSLNVLKAYFDDTPFFLLFFSVVWHVKILNINDQT